MQHLSWLSYWSLTSQDPSGPVRTRQDQSGSIRTHLRFIHAKFEQDPCRIGWVIKVWPLRTCQDPLGHIKTSGPNRTHLRLIHAKFKQDPIRIGWVIKVLPVRTLQDPSWPIRTIQDPSGPILGSFMPNFRKILLEFCESLKFDLSGPFRTCQDPSGPIRIH